MGLNERQIARLQPRPSQGIADRLAGLQSLGFRGHDVVAVTAAAAGLQPSLGRRPSPGQVAGPLQHQHPCPFREHKAIPIPGIGPGGLLRRVVAAGEGSHGGESHQAKAVHRGLTATGQHHIGPVVLQQQLGQKQGFGAGRTGRNRCVGPGMQAQVDGDLACRRVGDQHRHRERIHPPRAGLQQVGVLALQGGQAADAGADHHGNPAGVHPLAMGGGVGPGLTGRQQGQLGAAVEPPLLQGLEAGVEIVVHPAGNPGRQVGGPALLNRRDAGVACQGGFPGGIDTGAEGGDAPPAGDGQPFSGPDHQGTPGCAGDSEYRPRF